MYFQNVNFVLKEKVILYNLALLSYSSELCCIIQLSKLCAHGSQKLKKKKKRKKNAAVDYSKKVSSGINAFLFRQYELSENCPRDSFPMNVRQLAASGRLPIIF